MKSLLPYLSLLLPTVATGIGAWIASVIARAANHTSAAARAQVLAQIAADAAALVVRLYPTKPWAELLQETVTRITQAAGLPTTDQQAIERAAAGALDKLVPKPGA